MTGHKTLHTLWPNTLGLEKTHFSAIERENLTSVCNSELKVIEVLGNGVHADGFALQKCELEVSLL